MRATPLRATTWFALAVIVPLTTITASSMTQSAHASTSASGVSLAIDSISPTVARPGSTVTVYGTITNGTGSALAGLSVQLYSSAARFNTRDDMESYAVGTGNTAVTPEALPDALSSTVRPGGTVSWHASFNVANAGIAEFGVYPIEAVLTGADGGQLRVGRTLLPFWPDSTNGISKLKIAWVWPLIDQPHRQACAALTNNDLTQSLAGGGRLDSLLTAATRHPEANLTLAVDPALVGDANTMTQRYQVAGPGWQPQSCFGAIGQPASKAARTWLTTLKTATADQPVVLTPYANTDVAALTHHGLNPELKTAYRLGQKVAGQVLHSTFVQNLALPPAGLADQSVLTALATTEHVTSVVLSSGEMPPASVAGFSPDDAVTSVGTGAGIRMNVLLADDSLTNLLKSANAGMSRSAQFTLEQQFLAETAMIASEAPGLSRSVVVSPPQTWGPSLGIAQTLLSYSSAPWLRPVALSSLAGSHDAESGLDRKNPPSTRFSQRELSGAYLSQVSGVSDQLSTYKSMLDQAPPGYTMGLDEALAATESSAWRGGGTAAAQGQALTRDCGAYLSHAQSKVKIIGSTQITMAGASGVIPVSVQNGLEQQDVQVRLSAGVLPGAKGGAPPLVVSHVTELIKIPAGQTVALKIHINSAPGGTTAIKLWLTNRDGLTLPNSEASLTVNSTRYGQDILILIAGAIGLLVLTSLFRALRRWLNGADPAAEGTGPVMPEGTDPVAPGGTDPVAQGGAHPASTGNVLGGAEHLTEAPDELADARRWADDT